MVINAYTQVVTVIYRIYNEEKNLWELVPIENILDISLVCVCPGRYIYIRHLKENKITSSLSLPQIHHR